MFSKLKTIDRITRVFSLYNFLSLVLFLVIINITYFFIWYNQQKELSLHDMDMKYNLFSMPDSDMEIAEFREYLLERDTLIIPDAGNPICSAGVEKKVHENLSLIQDRFLFSYEGKTYFIFSQYYNKIGLVKVLFDTTAYVQSQIIIIKISVAVIFVFSLLSFFIGKFLSKSLLFPLSQMTQEVKNIHLDALKKISVPHTVKDDELRILAETMNKMIEKITLQTHNLKQFITDVSHEFKTPLMSMSSYLDVLQKKSEKGQDSSLNLVENIAYIKEHIKKLNTLLETLFFLAKIEDGIQKIEAEKFNLPQYFETKIVGMQKIFPDIQFSLELKVDTKNIEVNATLFDIVIENLLTNACKFVGKNKKVDITLGKNFCKIQDYGQGIDAQNLELIWEKFYKSNTNKQGFGVGLFLVKRVCDICRWKIEVTSELGKGTVFTLYI